MCLACEMDALWFAQIEAAEAAGADAPFADDEIASEAVIERSGEDVQRGSRSPGSDVEPAVPGWGDVRFGAAAATAASAAPFRCEEADPE